MSNTTRKPKKGSTPILLVSTGLIGTCTEVTYYIKENPFMDPHLTNRVENYLNKNQ